MFSGPTPPSTSISTDARPRRTSSARSRVALSIVQVMKVCRRRESKARSPRDGCSPVRCPLREELAPARVAPRDLRDSRLTRRATVAPADERVPEGRTSHGEPDEARDAGCRRQPGLDLRLVRAPSDDDATDAGAAGAPSRRDPRRAVLRPLGALDHPAAGPDPRILDP